MIAKIKEIAQNGDSIGGVIELVIQNCTPGLGEPVFDKLEAKLGHALLSIGAVKGIEFGLGFKVANMLGSECNDEFIVQNQKIKSKQNLAGGILGGISTGEEIVIRLAIKPTPSIAKKQATVSLNLEPQDLEITGRHDPCLCPRIVPVVEAMSAITLLDLLMINHSSNI